MEGLGLVGFAFEGLLCMASSRSSGDLAEELSSSRSSISDSWRKLRRWELSRRGPKGSSALPGRVAIGTRIFAGALRGTGRSLGGGGMPAGEVVRDESSCSEEKLLLSWA